VVKKGWLLILLLLILVACGNENNEPSPDSKPAQNQAAELANGELKEFTIIGKTGDKPEDFVFEPDEIKVKKGETVRIKVVSSNEVPHGLWIPDLHVRVEHEGTVEFVANEAGEYIGNCSQFCGTGHALMKLKVIVEE
jgi:cytochrome c oxidase subunit II